MPDPRFFHTHAPLSLAEACALAGAECVGNSDSAAMVERTDTVDAASLSGAAVFVEGVAAERMVLEKVQKGEGPALCFAEEAVAAKLREAAPCGVAPTPKAALAKVSARLHKSLNDADIVNVYGGALGRPAGGGVDPAADIDPTARIAPTAKIAAGARIGPNAVIGYGVEIGPDCRIGPNTTISHAVLGARVVLAAGVVIGEAGFGFAEGPTGAVPIPQLGIVEIGDDVEIGANSAVDRAAFGATVIGAGTKIDNLVQIAHNVKIGRSCMIAGQTALAGGAVLGDGVLVGGQSGVGNNVVIGDGARLGALSGAMRNVPAGETWGGVPALPTHLWWRSVMFLHRASRASPSDRADQQKNHPDEGAPKKAT